MRQQAVGTILLGCVGLRLGNVQHLPLSSPTHSLLYPISTPNLVRGNMIQFNMQEDAI